LEKIIVNSLRTTGNIIRKNTDYLTDGIFEGNTKHLPRNAKLLAWAIFLMFFIENGTLGILPKPLYTLYRSVRISDFILYGLLIYSLFNIKEYFELFNSNSLILLKVLFFYYILQFIASTFIYHYGVVEFFFRLKLIWASFMVFPFFLLIKRKAFRYMVRLFFPAAVFSNILYILSSLTGVAYLPDIFIAEQPLPGGLKVFRVFGGTFFGDVFMLGYIYIWITKKFNPRHLVFFILFALPQVLTFGRASWAFFTVTISIMFFWNTLKNKNFKTIFRQVAIAILVLFALFYVFKTFLPRSEYLTEAIETRIEQGQEDYTHNEGTYGSRLASVEDLLFLWSKSNRLFGIGMHPMWVIKPVTTEEAYYTWGFSDIKWAGVLAAYGLIGFLIIILIQIYYVYISYKILRFTEKKDIYIFFILIFFVRLVFDIFNYTYNLTSIGLWGPSFVLSFYMAVATYKYENLSG
jgi:hypothetical protein